MIQIHPICGTFGFSYLVTETHNGNARALLIDACAGCTPRKLCTLFARLNLRPSDLTAIQLTHAHIDHCINAAAIQQWSGAPVYCPVADKPYIHTHARYRGLNKIGGALEALARFLWRYKPPQNIRYFAAAKNPETIPHFAAVQAIALPGHTPGHTGYHIPAINTLIAGDLFAKLAGCTHAPPRIFTDDRHVALQSIAKAAALKPAHVYICHNPRADGAETQKSLLKLATRHANVVS